MLAIAASRLPVRLIARRAVVVAGQRQAAIQAVRRRDNVSVRGIQSIAQTDRVTIPLHAEIPVLKGLIPIGYYHTATVLDWNET